MKSFSDQGIDAYPLSWPTGWKRTQYKKTSKFKTTFAVARDHLMRELKLMGVNNSTYNTHIVLSSNVPLRRDGLPLAGQSNPKDPGVAVYFIYKGKPMVFACDTYPKVEDNLHAVTKTVEALRGIERWGASSMMERAFTGFTALPPSSGTTWWEILQVSQRATEDEIKSAFRRLAKVHHPDQGGSEHMMSKLNNAYTEAMKR